ncbi:MAG: WD40 repeat domain-containing protein, partial [Planctomycetota bacterium]
ETKPKPITQVHFFPNHKGDILARSLLDGIEIWDLSLRERLQKISAQRHLVFDVSPQGDFLYTTSFQDGLTRFQIKLTKTNERYRCEVGAKETLVEGFCTRLAVDSTGKRVAVIRQEDGSSYELQILSVDSGEVVTQVDVVPRLLSMEFSSDGSKIYGCHIRPPAVSAWSVETGDLIDRKELADGFLSSMSNRSNTLAIRSDFEARFVDLENWEDMFRFSLPKVGNLKSGASDSRDLSAVNLDDFITVLVNPSTGQELAHLESSPQDSIRFYDFSSDNRRLAVAANRNLQVWDLDKLREMLAELELNWTGSE